MPEGLVRSGESQAWWCRLAVDTAADAIIVADDGGVIRVWNQGATTLFGHSAAAAVGRRLELIIPEVYQGAHRAGFAGAMRTGVRRAGVPEVEFPALRDDGTTVQVQGTLTILRHPDSGTPTGAAVIVRRSAAQ